MKGNRDHLINGIPKSLDSTSLVMHNFFESNIEVRRISLFVLNFRRTRWGLHSSSLHERSLEKERTERKYGPQ